MMRSVPMPVHLMPADCASADAVHAAVGCNDEQLSALFNSKYTLLCRTVSRMLGGDAAIAEQAVMDAFEIVCARKERIRPATASSYLWQITINEARSVAKRQHKESALVDLAARRGYLRHEHEASGTGTAAERTVELEHVRRMVDALPVDQRIVVVLHYYCDWPDSAIASATGCLEVTVRSRLRRALKVLERRIGTESEER